MSLMKCQYFFALFASLIILPISSEYVFVAVSKPNDVSMSSFFRSPSIVFGQPMTWQGISCSAKYSASTAAFVLESSPPMMTMAFIPCFFATSPTTMNCSSVSSLVRPDPIISKPPVLRYLEIVSAVRVM